MIPSFQNNISAFIQSDLILKISKSLENGDAENYLIGGCVRDCLLSRKIKDIDIVTTGNAEKIAHLLAKTFNIKEVIVFKNFGTAYIKSEDIEIEIVTARKESYRDHSRKPEVEAGTLEDDQKRRDFTINAISISLNKTNYGHVFDPFLGLEDLENKILKTPLDPAITYSDDPLRMMRAIRFSAQLNFTIEAKSLQAITDNAHRISIVSGERIIDEINKIILSQNSYLGFDLLLKSGLLKILFPEMVALHGVEIIDGKGHKDNFYHTLKVLENISKNTDNLWLRWAAILHDIAKPPTKRFHKVSGWTFHGHEERGAQMVPHIFKRLKLPLDQKMKYVQKLVRLHLRPIALTKETITDSAVRRLLFEAGEDIDDLMTLCDADITSGNDFKVKKYLENFQKVRQKIKEVEERDKIKNWQPPIDGEFMMKELKIGPSREIGIIKNALKDAILDGIIENNHEAAYQFMIQKAKELKLIE